MGRETGTATGWLPMSGYPREFDGAGETWWGPTVLVRILPTIDWPHGPTFFVAHLEAGEWLSRDSGDPGSWGSLHGEPDAFMFIGIDERK